ncbi:MAG: cyclic nucleotide-binding domain-containing protein, partial [Candidatus Acidiferrales bacterium]
MPSKKPPSFDPAAFLTDISVGKTLVQYPKESVIFPQGKQADAVYYIQKGRVKLSVVSKEGKEAIIGVLG